MEPVTALMLLITCTDAMTGCAQHQEQPRTYATVAECEAEIVPAMMGLGTSPRIFGQCVELGQHPVEDVAWRVSSGGELMVNFEDTNIQLADIAQ